MDAYRVIRHPADEDEVARWACRARKRGPVEIASGPAPAVLLLGGLGCPRRSGEDSFYSSPGRREVQSRKAVRLP